MFTDRDLTAVRQAQKQNGFVTTAQLLASGATRHDIRRATRGGLLDRTATGLHVVTADPPMEDWNSRVHRAVAQVGVGAVAARFTAARLLGIAGSPAVGPLCVAVPLSRKAPQLAGIDIVRTRLPESDLIAAEDGLVLTSPLRTLMDCSRLDGHVAAVCVLESALRQGLSSIDEVTDRIAAMPRSPGVRNARRALANVDLLSESPLETALRILLLESGLPAPVLQLPFVVDGWRGRIDLAYPVEGARAAPPRYVGLAIEADGRSAHDDAETFHRDRRRHNALEEASWLVRRFTDRHVRQSGAYVVRTVRLALETVAKS